MCLKCVCENERGRVERKGEMRRGNKERNNRDTRGIKEKVREEQTESVLFLQTIGKAMKWLNDSQSICEATRCISFASNVFPHAA